MSMMRVSHQHLSVAGCRRTNDTFRPTESRNVLLRARQCEYGGCAKQDEHAKWLQGFLALYKHIMCNLF